ncbi:hypothetical protein P691DRAFT_801142 [Macrolepiota fuliginosa MF-IS2]|uniref:Uncharacterized protein n=1 Tax=Macrolepiota fuliginosa MF-IS2 TaxID=1400762 RepID=A0A9P5XM81_9AGAR|nr:hypothetical protein P691DRAFT_801142 [Macrolepiota fuliginosa MF-IS2]
MVPKASSSLLHIDLLSDILLIANTLSGCSPLIPSLSKSSRQNSSRRSLYNRSLLSNYWPGITALY